MLFIDYVTFTWNNGKRVQFHGEGSGSAQLEDFWQVFPEFEAWKESAEVDIVSQMRQYYTDTICLDPVSEFAIWFSKFNAAQGVMVNVPGSAMYELAQLLGDGCIPDGEAIPSYKVDAWPVLKKLIDRGCRITRLDVAWDDYKKVFSPKDLMRYWLDGKISTPARYAKCVASRQSGSDTFYLGKRGAERLLRIYDKAAESGGNIDAVRWEFEYRKEKAHAVAVSIASGNQYSMQLELLGDSGHVGFLVIKEYGCIAASAGGLAPGDSDYQYEHEKKSDSAIVKEWEDFVKHEIKVPDKEPVYISTKKPIKNIRGLMINTRNQLRNVWRAHVVAERAGYRVEMEDALRECFARFRAASTTTDERLRLDQLERELRADPEVINILR